MFQQSTALSSIKVDGFSWFHKTISIKATDCAHHDDAILLDDKSGMSLATLRLKQNS
jgi:hypothetical protein